MPRMSGIYSVVVILEVTAPLVPVLDGSAPVFSREVVLELGSKVGHDEACYCRCARHLQCA
jgi:UDP-3-O-acyl-N-acetylglucosamine deacetylase